MTSIVNVRTSERRSFKRCPLAWSWRYVEEITTLRPKNALWLGGIVHQALATWYLPGLERGPHPVETAMALMKEHRDVYVKTDEDDIIWVDSKDLVSDMLDHYVDTYGLDEKWFVLATEQDFSVLMKGRGDYKIRYLGTIDGAYRDLETGMICAMEHKTEAQSRDRAYLNLDDQGGSYWTFMHYILTNNGLIGKGDQIDGITYNFLRKALRDTRPQNEKGYYTNQPTKQHYVDALLNHFSQDEQPEIMAELVKDLPKAKVDALQEMAKTQGLTVLGEASKSQPSPFFERKSVFRTPQERRFMLDRIRDNVTYMEAIRRGDPMYPILKNPTMDCSFCEFFQLCQLHEQGDTVEVENMKLTMFKKESPYLAHEKDGTKEDG